MKAMNDSTTEQSPDESQSKQPKFHKGQPVLWRPEPHLPFRVYAKIIAVYRKHVVIEFDTPIHGIERERVERTTLEPREWREGEVR